MVYNTELLGFWTFSIVWYSREHDVSDLPQVKVGEKTPTQLGTFQWLRLALSMGHNWVGVFSPTFTWGRKQIVSETSCPLEYQTMEKVEKPSNSVCNAVVRNMRAFTPMAPLSFHGLLRGGNFTFYTLSCPKVTCLKLSFRHIQNWYLKAAFAFKIVSTTIMRNTHATSWSLAFAFHLHKRVVRFLISIGYRL
jgi:hypothetical protein